eukprot:TRINITY_DN915_c4_g1_i1.p1 TRINITY_DN915_c4_g1~~TRINITY_DN915_c4_g1_i1.p1  ORF type:complete len:648 (+),score=200.84 TRINITY_DN915_c4_g1_i1:78-2021(+)
MGRADGPRGVPFSAKQKRVQLQERKTRKAGRSAFGLRDEGGESDKPELHTTDGITTRDGVKQRSALRSVFAKEGKEEVAARRRAAQEPLEHRDFRQGVLYESWWDASGAAPPEQLPKAISLPPQPQWDVGDDREAVEGREKREFDLWQIRAAKAFGRNVNLFERNVEVWRQFWRVVSFSDVVALVVDARHPLFHVPASLVKLLGDLKKPIMLVLNKIDLVTREAVDAWKDFFARAYPSVSVCEFTCCPNAETVTSALSKAQYRRKRARHASRVDYSQFKRQEDENRNASARESDFTDASTADTGDSESESEQERFKGMDRAARAEQRSKRQHAERGIVAGYVENILATAARLAEGRATPLTIGAIGHPNVGKSSLINALRGEKVVSTSLTPGHTKHLQHIPLTENIRLCDCPGLTFPVLNLPQEVQSIMGTFPISQVREPYSAVAYLAARLPLEQIYHLRRPRGADDDEPWSGWMVCEAYAEKKGYFVKRGKGVPDAHRGGQHILKEALSGQLVLFFLPPPLNKAAEATAVEQVPPPDPDSDDESILAEMGAEMAGGEDEGIAEPDSPPAAAAGNGRGRRRRGRGAMLAKAGRSREDSASDGGVRRGGYHPPAKKGLLDELQAVGVGSSDDDDDEPAQQKRKGRKRK